MFPHRSAARVGRVSLLLLIAAVSNRTFPQRSERTLDEIKAEAIQRAENGMYPLIGLDPQDVKEAFAGIKTNDKDEWAASFMKVADRYMSEGNALAASDAAKADQDYVRAWRLYSFGRWPVPSSPGKQRSYEKALQAFLAHARFLDPPIEVVHVPFAGREITGYLRLPKNVNRPLPLVIAINGLDSRKEDLAESFSAILPYGIGFLAIDGPGTGQSPIKATVNAERMLSRVIDYAQSIKGERRLRRRTHHIRWRGDASRPSGAPAGHRRSTCPSDP